MRMCKNCNVAYQVPDKMSKKKMPPEVLEVFKKKEAKNKDGSDMDDKTKRKAALEKARSYKQQKAK